MSTCAFCETEYPSDEGKVGDAGERFCTDKCNDLYYRRLGLAVAYYEEHTARVERWGQKTDPEMWE